MKKISFKKAFFIIFFLLFYTFIISFACGGYYNDYKSFQTSINYIKIKDVADDKIAQLPDENYNAIENEFSNIIKESLTINIGNILPSISDYFIELPDNSDKFKLDYYKDGNKINVKDIANYDGTNYYAKLVGSYDVFVGGFVSKLVVVDEVKPIVTFKNLSIYENSTYSANDFIAEYKDNSMSNEYIALIKNSDNASKTKAGTYNISIMVCDNSMNCVNGTAKLNIMKKPTSSGSSNNSGNNSPGNSSNNNGSESSNNTGSNNADSNISSGNTDNNGDNSVNSSNNTTNGGSGDEGNTGGTTEAGPPVYVKDIEEKEIVSTTEIKYGVKNIGFMYTTYELYSDGSKIKKYSTEVYYSIDYSGFNGTTSSMKDEAYSVYATSSNTRNTFLTMTNSYRSEVGVHNLALDKTLSVMATIRAMEIAYSRKFSHTRPDGSPWNTIITDSNFSFYTTYAGENLAGNFDSDEAAVLGLRKSTGHYQNMINSSFNKLGVGVYTFNGSTYWVQLFAK